MNNKEVIRLIKEIKPILYGSYKEAFDCAIKAIETVDKTKVEFKANWIDVNGECSLWECSKCGEKCCCIGKYCMGCGAKMINADEVKQLYEGQTMTNKEIIEQLEWVKKRISEITYSPESFEAINLAIEALKNERQKGEWIPVSERLPKFSGLYLISIDSLVTVMNFSGTHFTNRGGVRVEVDAWQPLPEPYKEADNEDQT